jgi:predicted nucleotidyltransferase
MIDFEALIRALTESNVEFIIIGGLAASAHGSARATSDLDVIYRRTTENIDRLVRALAPLNPYLRGAPAGLPFVWDARTIRNGLNFTLLTSKGDLDLLGEVTGGGSYEQLLPDSIELELFGMRTCCLALERLIHVKRAAGRPKDFEAVAELEAILEEKQRRQADSRDE